MPDKILRALFGLATLVALQQTALADSTTTTGPAGTVEPAPVTSVPVPKTTSGTLVAQMPAPPPKNCTTPEDVYKTYTCLDRFLGEDVLTRLFNYYRLEWGQAGPPEDPNAPPGRIEGWPRTPATIPPMAYTEWPTGAMTSIGVTRPNSADSPFMASIANTSLGRWMYDNHVQFYGWVNGGFNVSTNTQQPGGNAPIGYAYTPNTPQLDQAVIYFERLPDTVQTTNFDWGFRLSYLYGENYRYTNSYGLGSYQFNGHNYIYGWDVPMEYLDLYWPRPFNYTIDGLEVRIGRYISIPDIEAQLAPNNITYTHSLTYTWDNYTNNGIVTSWQINPSLLVQLAISDGTETPIWNCCRSLPNLFGPNPLYDGPNYRRDPGNQPSATACVRVSWNDGWDNFYPCLNGLNNGKWGYNNLQWLGYTYYHRFNDKWHIDFENYFEYEQGVPNLRNPTPVAIFEGGGTPFSPQNVQFNPPNLAYCGSITQLSCMAYSVGAVAYINYTFDPLNNFTFRPEFYDDPQGWRTGTGGRTQYYEFTLSWQHWLSPQIEFRPEISYWRSVGTPAFNGYSTGDVAANRFYTAMFAADMILHF
jgi:Putative beta-barrel porin-2, OmpL-like. bbp2